MEYTIYDNGLIRCEDDKCGEWHHGGHDLEDILPGNKLTHSNGNGMCIGCGKDQGFHLHCKIKIVGRMIARMSQ